MNKNYLILAHKNPDQLKGLVERLDEENARFYIHLDLKTDLASFEQKLKQPNVVFTKKREKCLWGDISLVQATLHCMNAVLEEQRKGYCILLSGQDYPIKSNAEINEYLSENFEYDFVDLVPIEELWKEEAWRFRVNHYKFDLSDSKDDILMVPSVFSKEFYDKYTYRKLKKLFGQKHPEIKQVLRKRNFPPYLQPFGGPQWWALKVTTVEKIMHFLETHEDYLVYHQFSFCSDEFFFHSILQALSKSGRIKVMPGITFVNWKSSSKVSPEIFEQKDLARLLIQPRHQLFARKFDVEVDQKIFKRIDDFNTKDKKSKIKEMQDVLSAAAIIPADYDLVTVNEHTFINSLNYQSTVVDLGGNKGGFSILALKLFYCKKVVIVEGNPRMIPIIENNLVDYKEKAEIINALIGPTYSKAVDFHICEDSEASMVNKSLNESQKILETVPIEMLSMKEIYERVGDQKIDLLKVDVEGMEWEILKQFTSKDYEKIDQIAVEFHDFLDTSLRYKTEEVKTHLEGLGYVFVKGMYGIWADYYDCLFCKPELYAKYLAQKANSPRAENQLSLQQQYIFKEQEIVAIQKQHQKDIKTIHQSLSWKITAPVRKLAAILGYK